MIKTDRNYQIPQEHDSLQDSLPMLQHTLKQINEEQNQQDKQLKKAKRRAFIEQAYGGQIWLRK